MNFYPILRPLLFKLDPESAHQLTLGLMRLAGAVPPFTAVLRSIYNAVDHPVEAFGLIFTHPIGLAAGYDKDGLAWQGLACLGFSHIEVGTVTPKPQPGNLKPRLFRLSDDNAIINRMGFPGRGADFVLKQVSKPRPKNLILGVNIGKNKDTPLEVAIEDYLYLLKVFYRHTDYFSVNVSSPNTIGLQQLQERRALHTLLEQLNSEREKLIQSISRKVPILVKLSPDLTDQQLADALEVSLENHIEGVIATNTTLTRDGVHSPLAREAGGLSGRPLFERSLEMVKKIHRQTNGKLAIVGAGGISNASGVQKMMDAGAVLVQLYTGLIYEGPGLVKIILTALPRTSSKIT